MKEVKECRICINNTKNPSIKINDDGICNICEHYNKYFKRSDIETEKEFIKTFITNKKYDCMVGLSGWKDSSAMLYTVKELGFTPLAFSFKLLLSAAKPTRIWFSFISPRVYRISLSLSKIKFKSSPVFLIFSLL